MASLLFLFSSLVQLYVWVIIASAVLSWLIAFEIVNRRNQAVAMIWFALHRLTEPLLAPVRRLMPDLGGIDLSPVIVILLLVFLNNFLHELAYGLVLR